MLIERLQEYRTALITRTVTRGLPPEAIRAAGSSDAVLMGGEVGHNDLAVGVFIREDRPEVASFIEAEKRIAWIHEARA